MSKIWHWFTRLFVGPCLICLHLPSNCLWLNQSASRTTTHRILLHYIAAGYIAVQHCVITWPRHTTGYHVNTKTDIQLQARSQHISIKWMHKHQVKTWSKDSDQIYSGNKYQHWNSTTIIYPSSIYEHCHHTYRLRSQFIGSTIYQWIPPSELRKIWQAC